MAGPQVRGDIKVSRNVQSRKVRQGVRVFKPTPTAATVTLTSGDPYTISLEPTPTTVPPTTATAGIVQLPVVSAGSVISTGSGNDLISTPTGPASGIGTEFRIHNTSNFDAVIQDSGTNSVLVGGLPSGNTAIAYCTDATTSTGVWNVYVVDAAASQLTPRNIPFTAAEGTSATGSISISGTSTVAGAVSLTFSPTSGTQLTTTDNLAIGTTAVQAITALLAALNADTGFLEFYTATLNGTTQIDIASVDNGTRFNAATLDVTVPTGLTGTDGTLTGGSDGSWTRDTPNSESFFSIPQVRHQRGLDPIFSVYENDTANGTRSEVLIESTVTTATGEIRIIVNITPLGIFAGSVDVL